MGQHLDVPLSDGQAAALGRRLAGVGFERVVASPCGGRWKRPG